MLTEICTVIVEIIDLKSWKSAVAKFHDNRLRIDWVISEKLESTLDNHPPKDGIYIDNFVL